MTVTQITSFFESAFFAFSGYFVTYSTQNEDHVLAVTRRLI